MDRLGCISTYKGEFALERFASQCMESCIHYCPQCQQMFIRNLSGDCGYAVGARVEFVHKIARAEATLGVFLVRLVYDLAPFRVTNRSV